MNIKNAKVLTGDFDFRITDVMIEGGRFTDVSDNKYDGIDMTGKYIVPGLIDIHTHGAVGCDNSDQDSTSIENIAEFMLKNGVTTFAPTLITGSEKSFIDAAMNVAKYINDGEKFSRIAGIHMEGPYFSKTYKGAQNEKYLRNPDASEFRRINAASGNIVKLISLAPELEGALDFISEIKAEAVVSIGHTDSDYDTAAAAIAAGAAHMTHTFNAMRSFHHRNPNAIGAAFDSNITCECICDGIHVHPAAVRSLYKLIGRDRLVFISDSVRATGMEDGVYDLGGQDITVRNGKATLSDGTIAGSTATLLRCVRKAIEFGIPAADAFKCATINPAAVMKIDDRAGSIENGKNADFLVLDENFRLCSVYKNGIEAV
ncbi:MAG: N-acetylglucosamine-6-phosphate deacetylase [Clostridia bacterium]|nr:N-acetylglucosamine-6-phosphate deacetylase [Clostridia bacterium]